MNQDFDFYLINIKTQNYITDLTKIKILEFYDKYKNIYEFDNLMNVSCKNCTNSFCCINNINCKNCLWCYCCKNCEDCTNCINCENLKNKNNHINNK